MHEITVSGGRKLLLFFANNKGRGGNNCTIFLVDQSVVRKKNTKAQLDEPYFGVVWTSAWRGKPNLSKRTLAYLGLTKEDLRG